MPFLFKLTKRLATSRAIVILAVGIAGCTATDHATTDPNASDSLQAQRNSSTVARVSVTPSSAAGSLGQSAQFSAAAYSAGGALITGRAVAWSSTDSTVVSITSSGLATAVGVGQVNIVATISGIRGTAQATVSGDAIAAIAVSPNSANGTIGQTQRFTPTLTDASGSTLTGRRVVWTSSNPSVATIDSTGLATGIGAGSATITASSAGKGASASFTVGGTQTVTNPAIVTDLAITSIADTTATLSFTQVTDGTGKPASYEIRFAVAPISWGSATPVARGTCASPIAGTAIGAKVSCTVNGLTASTAYNFQIVAYRGTLNVNAVFGALSNALAASTTSGIGVLPPPANVFFQESFDDANLAARGWYDNTNLLITTSDHTGAATASAQFHFLAGATTPTSGGAIRHKFPASNSMYVAYDVKYSANWVGSEQTYHPHEFYALSTWDADYDGLSNNWLTLYLEENYQNGGFPRMSMQDNKSINTALGALPISLVGLTEDRSTAGCNGMVETNMPSQCYNAPPWYNLKEADGPVVFQPNPGSGYKNNWNHVEAYYQLNTIVNGVGQANGVMQYWFNGTLIIDRHDVLFITGARAGLQLTQFVIAPYIGVGSPVDQSMWVDNIVVAAARGSTP